MTHDPFAPDRIGRAISAADLDALKGTAARGRLPRPGKGEQYLGGPIPAGWLERAGRLPGKALHLGIALWFAAVRSRGKDPAVALTDALAGRFGLNSRSTRSRAIGALEGAGLVAVERHPGRAPVVTILPAGNGPTGLESRGGMCDNSHDGDE
jgi:hypothetical protein